MRRCSRAKSKSGFSLLIAVLHLCLYPISVKATEAGDLARPKCLAYSLRELLLQKSPLDQDAGLDPQVLSAITQYREAKNRINEAHGYSRETSKENEKISSALNQAQLHLTQVLNDRASTDGKHLVAPLGEKYIGEEKGNFGWVFNPVEYYETPIQWAAFRLTIKNGKIYDSRGKLFDTRDAIHEDADGDELSRSRGTANFVMDRDGSIFADKFPRQGSRHHSSLLAGTPAASAGEIIVKDGVLVQISSKSRHYKLPKALNDQILGVFKQAGVVIQPDKVDFRDQPDPSR